MRESRELTDVFLKPVTELKFLLLVSKRAVVDSGGRALTGQKTRDIWGLRTVSHQCGVASVLVSIILGNGVLPAMKRLSLESHVLVS